MSEKRQSKMDIPEKLATKGTNYIWIVTWGRRGCDNMVVGFTTTLCNQCQSPPMLWVRIPLRRCVLYATLCDKVCQWLAAGRWFSPGTTVYSTNKTVHIDIIEILLKVALNIITLTLALWIVTGWTWTHWIWWNICSLFWDLNEYT
jgi:hypothetical protein